MPLRNPLELFDRNSGAKFLMSAPKPKQREVRVKTGKAPCEQMFSAVHPTTDIAKILRHVRFVPTSDFGIRGRCATLDDVETLCGREYRWHSTVSAGAPSISKGQTKEIFTGTHAGHIKRSTVESRR